MLNIPKIQYFLVENIMENNYESKDKNTPLHNVSGKLKYLQTNLALN